MLTRQLGLGYQPIMKGLKTSAMTSRKVFRGWAQPLWKSRAATTTAATQEAAFIKTVYVRKIGEGLREGAQQACI